METVKQQTLFIDTQHGIGESPSDKTIVIPPGLIECKPNQMLRLSVVSFQCFCDTPNVNSRNNNVRFTNESTDVVTEVTIPPGCYTAGDLIDYMKYHGYPDLKLSFIKPRNSFELTFTEPHTVQWLNESYKLFGFLPTDDVIYKTTITGTQVVELEPFSSIRIDLDNSVNTINNANLANCSGTVAPWNTIASIPLTYLPYSWITHQPIHSTPIYVQDYTLNQLRLFARAFDKRDQEIGGMPDYKLVLLIETLEKPSKAVESLLKSILECQQLEYLSRVLLNVDGTH